jgi:flagella basal body P-ring formation protein FlgA
MALPQSTRSPNRCQAALASFWLGLCALLGALPDLVQAQIATLATATPTAFAALSPSSIQSATATAAASPATSPAATLPAAATDHEVLFAQARQWVMAREQLPADQVRFAALDSRVRIAPCRESLQFDYPFSSSRETVRVRCDAPTAWQLFLRLNNPPAALARPASNPNAPIRASAAVTMQPPMKTVVVPKRLLPRGTEIDASMLEEVQKPALGLDPLAIGSLKDVARAEAVRDLPAGMVLRSYDIKRSLMVRKGQSAMLTVGQNGSFQITVRVEAQQDGHLGEQIRLKNPESGRLISGVVTGPNALKGL